MLPLLFKIAVLSVVYYGILMYVVLHHPPESMGSWLVVLIIILYPFYPFLAGRFTRSREAEPPEPPCTCECRGDEADARGCEYHGQPAALLIERAPDLWDDDAAPFVPARIEDLCFRRNHDNRTPF